MRQSIIIIYTILTAIIAFVFIFLEIQPALVLINMFSTDGGNSFYFTPVLLLLWLLFLSPLIVYNIVSKLLRKMRNENIDSERTGVFVLRHKAFQSSLVGIPFFIDGKRAGVVDNGKTKFFDIPEGIHTIQVGKGLQSSEILQISIFARQQLHFEMKILSLGLRLKNDLTQINKFKNDI